MLTVEMEAVRNLLILISSDKNIVSFYVLGGARENQELRGHSPREMYLN
jgi:hypothetical protein